jgi:hypothetical protein
MRKNFLQYISVVIAVCAIAFPNRGRAQATNTNGELIKLSEQIEHQLLILNTNKTEESVLPLINLLNNLESIQPNAGRKLETSVWLEVVTAIDSNINTNFDELKADFVMNVLPPPDGDNGFQYPPGITPDTLKDPIARSKYEAAIILNRKNAESFNFQLKLHRLDKEASINFQSYLKRYYTASDVDKEELREALAKFKLSSERRQQVYKNTSLGQP